jgi:hypothetical protein
MRHHYHPQLTLLFLALRNKGFYLAGALFLWITPYTLSAQSAPSRIAQQIAAHDEVFKTLGVTTPLSPLTERTAQTTLASEAVEQAIFFSIRPEFIENVLQEYQEYLMMEIPIQGSKPLRLKLQRADVFSSSFQLFTAMDPSTPYPYEKGKYYWGVVENQPSSLVALSFTRDEIMGFIQVGENNFTLGKLKDDPEQTHILYKTDELKAPSGINCFVDESFKGMNDHPQEADSRSSANCVRMVIHVDYDIFVQKGSVQAAADYVNGAFSQVAILYTNEAINLVVNEMIVWNAADPFTGPTTNNYLNQFQNYLGGNFNGDLAHLVGYNGGGGVAYLDVLCDPFYGIGYSGISSSYSNVPAYSWTIEVLTHEIGHNLGSQHTHACAWNGNNTAIDGCGPAAGYSEGCNAPLPVSGTIMSYCHLIGGVGINFNNGFGPQPGDRIRDRVYNSPCLTICGPPIEFDAGITAITSPIALPCENNVAPVVTLKNFGATTLTSVIIHTQLDNGTIQNYNWTGTLTQNQSTNVTLPGITYTAGNHTFKAYTESPNGQQDEVISNDLSTKAFNYIVDWCVCNAATASIAPNPLTHTGSGSSAASVSFAPGSKKPAFTISNLDSKTNGPQHSRFIDIVTVTYIDGNGVNRNYGTFSGATQNTVNVSILDFVNSISVTLSNGLGNNGYSGTLSVSFTSVSYCSPTAPCPDADSDGVCDVDDVCPGFDDNLIGTACNDGDACTNNDVYTTSCICAGTPIPGCGDCDQVTSNFSPNPLTHLGTGQHFSNVTLPVNNSDATFTISGLDAKLNGNPTNRYIDQVTVTYVNGGGATVQYGVFRGDQVSTVNVSIPGAVQSIQLALQDIYDGNSSPTTLSVSMTSVTSCSNEGALIGTQGASVVNQVVVYPNPTSGELFVQLDQVPERMTVKIFNALGVLAGTFTYDDVKVARIPLESTGLSGNQLLFISVQADGREIGMKRVMMGN